jgi:hypothetical protein
MSATRRGAADLHRIDVGSASSSVEEMPFALEERPDAFGRLGELVVAVARRQRAELVRERAVADLHRKPIRPADADGERRPRGIVMGADAGDDVGLETPLLGEPAADLVVGRAEEPALGVLVEDTEGRERGGIREVQDELPDVVQEARDEGVARGRPAVRLGRPRGMRRGRRRRSGCGGAREGRRSRSLPGACAAVGGGGT